MTEEQEDVVGSLFSNASFNHLSRKGEQVNILLVFGNAIATTSTLIGKVPVGFIPSKIRYLPSKCSIGSQWLPMSIKIDTNGNIYANEYAVSNLQNVGCYGTYFL